MKSTKQSGMTLVEVMIAMLLGLLLVGGVLEVFASSRQTYRVHESLSRMQESGRMALEVIGRDFRMAGFWGCAGSSNTVVNNLDNGGGGFVDFGAGGILGVEGGAIGTPDSVTLRGGANSGLALQPPYGPTTSTSLNVSAGNTLQQDDILMISDCESADVFQVTNSDPAGTGTIEHVTGSGTPGNLNVTDPGCVGPNAHCLSKIYTNASRIYVARQTAYTVGTSMDTGQPALFRNGQEFLDGVENLQVLYGEDTDLPGSAGFGIANYYVPANQVTDMGGVVSIRFAVVTRSYDDNIVDGAAQTYNILGTNVTAPDNRLRQVYTSTVTLRNRL